MGDTEARPTGLRGTARHGTIMDHPERWRSGAGSNWFPMRDAPSSPVPPRLLSIQATAAALGIGRTTLFRLMRSGELRPLKIGRRTLVAREDIERLIASARRVA